MNATLTRHAATAHTDLKGKVVIVTGASGLLGAAFSDALAGAGATPVNLDLRDPPTNDHSFIRTDLTDTDDTERAIAATLETHDRIDALVNNAAIDPKFDTGAADLHTHAPEHYPLDALRRSLDTNLVATTAITQAVARHLIRTGTPGSIVNIASTYALVSPQPALYDEGTHKPFDYGMTKAALLYLTKHLATHWARHNIRVNTLTPGGVRNNQPDDFQNRYAQRTPLNRMAEPHELAPPLLFLLSDASSYMTGQNLIIDGGWTAW